MMRDMEYMIRDMLIEWQKQLIRLLHYLRSQIRMMTRPGSLSLQTAIVAVTIAIGSIIAVLFLSSIAVSTTFSSYLQSQLQSSVNSDASGISSHYSGIDGDLKTVVGDLFIINTRFQHNNDVTEQPWIMDSLGNVTTYTNTPRPDDNAVLVHALRLSLQTGKSYHGELSDDAHFLINYSARAYAVAPIYDNTQQKIIGAIGLSSEKTLSGAGGPGFIQSVNRFLFFGGAAIAIITAVIGALLARRITQPLGVLTKKVAQMKSGDFSTRMPVEPDTMPVEIEQLSLAFNEMVAQIEQDILKLRRQEMQQRELVANVSHELATPLTSIRGLSEALADNMITDPQEREEISRLINKETTRLQGMVDHLRQVARLESRTDEMDLAPTNMKALVADTILVLQSEATRNGVTMTNAIDDGLPLVQADANRLTQVMLNLLDNARQHTPPGGHITVTSEQRHSMVWITVADTGVGIEPKDIGRLFERFYRTDSSRSRNTGGSGLGLAIVKAIIETHGGKVQAANNNDGGASMSFSLPVATDQSDNAFSNDEMPQLSAV